VPVSALPGAELPVGPQLHLVVYASLVDVACAVPPLLDIDADVVLHLARQTPSFATVTDVTDSNAQLSISPDDATRDSAAATPGPATIGRAAATPGPDTLGRAAAIHADCSCTARTAFDA